MTVSLLISLLVAVIVIGLAFWLVGMLPFDAKLMQIVRVILVVICVLYVLQMLFHPFGGYYIRN